MENKNTQNADIVLLQLPFWGACYPPLALALLKSYLAENNISCKTFDLNIQAYLLRGDKYNAYWDASHGYNFCDDRDIMLTYYKDNRALILYYMNEIKKLNPKVVAVSCVYSSFFITQLFLEDLRNMLPGYKHILGGCEVAGFMKNAGSLLEKNFVDAVNLDEGEISLVKYVNAVIKDSSEPIPGIIYKNNGKIIDGGKTIPIKNLNELPFPDFSDFNLKNYITPNVLPTYTSRGCLNKCIYCSSRGFLAPYRNRSAKRVFEEIKYLKELYPEVTYFRTADNISNSNVKELEEFCDLMIEARLRVKWNLEDAVIRKEMRTPLYKKLKKAGCTVIGYGLENPSKKLLEQIGKKLILNADIPKVLKEGKKAGLFISVNIMFGLPGETDEDFQNLLEFLRKNRRSLSMVTPSITFCEFYPGSIGREEPEKYGIDLTKGHLFWESPDGKNNFLVRMRRFEEFCRLAKKFKLHNLYNVQELSNKHKLLFRYYFVSKDYRNALNEFKQIPKEQLSNEIKEKYQQITTGKFQKEKETIISLKSELYYGRNFEETFLYTSLGENLKNLELGDVFRNIWLGPWKSKIRKLSHKIIGYDRIEKKINNIYTIIGILDEKLRLNNQKKD